jgi:hypothetical protein
MLATVDKPRTESTGRYVAAGNQFAGDDDPALRTSLSAFRST